jgi:hypothetical protein
MSISEQRANETFKTFMCIIPIHDDVKVTTIIKVEDINFRSIINFYVKDINDEFCVKQGSKPVEDCNVIKAEIKESINRPGEEASIQPDDHKKLDKNFAKKSPDRIELLNRGSKIFLPAWQLYESQIEIKRRQQTTASGKTARSYHPYRSASSSSTRSTRSPRSPRSPSSPIPRTRAVSNIAEIPYVIIYGNLKGQSDTTFHVSAVVVYGGEKYSFGLTSLEHLANPGATVFMGRSVISTPETIDFKYGFFVIDVQILTKRHVFKLKQIIKEGTLTASVDVSKPYTTGISKDTYGLTFNQNILLLRDQLRYSKFVAPVTSSLVSFLSRSPSPSVSSSASSASSDSRCVDIQNCSSIIQDIFGGIVCNDWNKYATFSHPNACHRVKGNYSIDQLEKILRAITENDTGTFLIAINENGRGPFF